MSTTNEYKPTEQWLEGRQDALSLIVDERRKQLMKWGEQNHDDGIWMQILIEEVGELSQEMLRNKFGQDKDEDKKLAEAVQVAAVAAAYIQWLQTGKA